MPTPGDTSSDYFDDDPNFLQALHDAVLDGDLDPSVPVQQTRSISPIDVDEFEMPPPAQPSLKRPRSPAEDLEGSTFHQIIDSVAASADSTSYLSSHTYGASRFGDFGEYMARKRAKLQIQNTEMIDEDNDSSPTATIFRGLQVYINGWTEPSVQELRELIIQHGGIYHAYLDKKSLVTHILTCSLTPAKIREFKHMKVVRPEWLVESARAGHLLPWQDFIFRPGERTEQSQGKRIGQQSLFDKFVSQARVRPSEAKAPPVATQRAPSNVQDDDDSVEGPPTVPLYGRSPSITPPQTPTKERQPHISKPLFTTDPTTPEHASRVVGYAAHTSNPIAERAMANPAWRAAHTSAAPDFIEGYYKNSRLHHLSTWKAELKNLVAEAQEHIENGTVSSWNHLPDGTETAVGKIMQQNIGGLGRDDPREEDVSMRGAHLVAGPSNKVKGKERAAAAEQSVIMHCDFDSFFVSAGLLDRPHLRGKPVVVCHSQGNQGGGASTSEIASASYEARKFGIKSGMSLQQARRLCPTVLTIPYEFQRYKKLSLQCYTVLMAHADDLQAVSVDEALIDVTSSVARIRREISRSQDPSSSPVDPAKEFAEAIRAQVKKVTGCEVSVGISYNIMLARLASRKAKPAGSFHIIPDDVPELLAPLDIDDLHGFGYAARQKALEKLGATKLGELVKKSKATLCEALGKGMGETLYKALRGVDERKLESDKPRKSVSCDINYGIRFENNEQAEAFISQMAEEVARRLNNIGMIGRSLTLKIMKRAADAPVEAPKFLGHGICDTFNKQTPLIAPGSRATSDRKVIGEHAWRLLKSFHFDPKELRGISIQIQKLEKNSEVSATESGQAVLPFKPKSVPDTKDAPIDPVPVQDRRREPGIVVEPPSQELDAIQLAPSPDRPVAQAVLDLPSFSQVDMSVFQALPDDVRKELETEYHRRSITPGLQTDRVSRSRSPSVAVDPKFKITVKGANVKRITQQLAPRSRPSISPKKNTLFAKRSGSSAIHVSEWELRKLNIDPGVFAMLPVDVQKEQLAAARGGERPGASVYVGERKVLKPSSKVSSSFVPYRAPPPQAKYLQPPFLKQQGKVKGEKLYFTETDDVQRVIETWVDGFKEFPPNQKDVDYFAKFLVQCVDSSRSSDTGVEKAVAVVKWWRVLLRRHFAVWEHAADDVPEVGNKVTSERVGCAWWAAFREVKAKMDAVARKKFGGSLSLK
ncbi:uncharacterized protein FIBRA_06713 [Fibroporia radiculosa]|uniref:DNA repair protein REV1 n=1 Tax=Fibroporia radiculosa TaxID=599839 RepID=J4HZJ3_9APHY|nr:uncharacterized protein FIBRA_06713 [Fibroporia radiculosa]CCM04532.1 predicted protein [Fibroporia radiculosa]